MTVAEEFARFGADFGKQPVSPDVLHHAKRAVIDWYAALLPGAEVAPATMLEKALTDELNTGACTLALGRKASARAAALINGTAAHTMEVDDIFREAIYHPGAPTIAAGKKVSSLPAPFPDWGRMGAAPQNTYRRAKCCRAGAAHRCGSVAASVLLEYPGHHARGPARGSRDDTHPYIGCGI